MQNGRKHKRFFKLKITILSILVIILAVLGLHELTRALKKWDKNMVDVDFKLPVHTLAEMEGSPDFIYSDIVDNRGNNYNNHITYNWSIFSPTQYLILQKGTIPEKQLENKGTYESSIEIMYYDMAFEWMAKPYYKQLINKHIRYKTDVVMETLDTPYFEGATYGVVADIQYLTAYHGKEVIFVVYSGGIDLRENLDKLLVSK